MDWKRIPLHRFGRKVCPSKNWERERERERERNWERERERERTGEYEKIKKKNLMAGGWVSKNGKACFAFWYKNLGKCGRDSRETMGGCES